MRHAGTNKITTVTRVVTGQDYCQTQNYSVYTPIQSKQTKPKITQKAP